VGSRVALNAVEYRKKSLLPFARYRTSAVQPHYGPRVNSASNRKDYQEFSWGVKGGRRVKQTPTAAICEPIVETKYGSIDVSQSYGPPRSLQIFWLHSASISVRPVAAVRCTGPQVAVTFVYLFMCCWFQCKQQNTALSGPFVGCNFVLQHSSASSSYYTRPSSLRGLHPLGVKLVTQPHPGTRSDITQNCTSTHPHTSSWRGAFL
jgi:hypothetical protein